MQRISKYCFGLLFVIFYSCNKETAPDCFKQSGTITTLSRSLNSFRNLVVNSDLEVEIFQSNETRIEISGGKNLVPKVSSSITDGTLELDNLNGCNFVRGYKKKITIKLYTPKLRTISSRGVGDIHLKTNFLQDSLQVNAESVGDIYVNGTFNELVANTGSHGDIYVEGNANRFYGYISGTNYLHAEQLNGKYVNIITNCLGDCFLNLDQTEIFTYTINNSGNIYYSGEPKSIVNEGSSDSKGKLIFR